MTTTNTTATASEITPVQNPVQNKEPINRYEVKSSTGTTVLYKTAHETCLKAKYNMPVGHQLIIVKASNPLVPRTTCQFCGLRLNEELAVHEEHLLRELFAGNAKPYDDYIAKRNAKSAAANEKLGGTTYFPNHSVMPVSRTPSRQPTETRGMKSLKQERLDEKQLRQDQRLASLGVKGDSGVRIVTDEEKRLDSAAQLSEDEMFADNSSKD